MDKLTDHTSYADAQRLFAPARLWELVDGTRERLNIAHECIDRHVAPGRIALRIAHADGRDETLTFEQVARASAQVAHWLQARGVHPGDRVAIMLEPGFAYYACVFGAIKLGAIAVPLFTLFGPDGLRLRIGDCDPKMLILGPDKVETAREVQGPEIVVADGAFLRSLEGLPPAFSSQTRADDLAVFQYTSGTTRELPEAVRHSHRAIVTLMSAALYGTGIRPGDRFMCPSSPAWGHGLWHGTLAPLAMGVTTSAYAGRFDPVRLMQALQQHDITNLAAAATHYRMMRNSGAAGRFRYAIRKLSFTGEPIDSETLSFCGRTFGVPVCSMYGTTEIGVILVNYPGAADFAVKPGSLGKPVPGGEVQVQRADGTAAAPDEIGELKVRRRGTWIATKDLGRVDEDGYFWHGGRADDVIISAGWTMSAMEIEDAILKHADVREAAAIGVPDALRGQVVKAFVVPRRPGDAALVQEIQDLVRSRLSQHEYPRIVAFVDELPKTPAGKINRKVLRAREQALAAAPQEESRA